VSSTQRNSVLRLQKNQQGKDYIVGDIHGHFELFDLLLKELAFNPECDRMISVGDGIDRGPESNRVLEYWQQPWFYAVRGNHEAMLMAAREHKPGIYGLWMANGGEWAEQVSEALLDEMATYFAELPYAISVETEYGDVGVVHADMPMNLNWQQLLDKLENQQITERELQVLLWSRESYRKLRLSREYVGAIREYKIDKVHKVYVGHCVVDTPTLFGNMMFIDTGAYCNGNLTAVDLSTEELIIVQAGVAAY